MGSLQFSTALLLLRSEKFENIEIHDFTSIQILVIQFINLYQFTLLTLSHFNTNLNVMKSLLMSPTLKIKLDKMPLIVIAAGSASVRVSPVTLQEAAFANQTTS